MMGRRLTRTEVVRLLQVDEGFIVELEQESIVSRDADDLYAEPQVERMRVSRTLSRDLGVNLAGVEVALQLMDRIHAERRQFVETLAWLKKRMEEPE